jgi:hypothetical protein
MARFRGGDLGYYYVRELPDGRFVWAGEYDQNVDAFNAVNYEDGFVSRRFANVFFGRRQPDGSVAGDYFDVPKGLAQGSGELTVQARGGGHEVDGTFRTRFDPEAGAEWAEWRSGSSPIPPRFQGPGTDGLTGTWLCDDGGTYYLRRIGNRVMWFGEGGSGGFANVFDGSVTGTTLSGDWVDVPKFAGGANSQGTLSLNVQQPPAGPSVLELFSEGAAMDRTARTGGFGGRRWQKVDFSYVFGKLLSLRLFARTESSGADPYLWVIWAKVDGDTVDILDPGAATIFLGPNSGAQNNVTGREDLPSGTTLPIPRSFGEFNTRLTTLRNLNPTHDFMAIVPNLQTAMLFLIVAGWEEDASSRRVSRAIYREVRQVSVDALTAELRRVLRQPLTAPRNLRALVESAIVANFSRIFNRAISAASASLNVGLFLDPDDLLGVEVRTFTLNQLRGRVTPLRMDVGPYRVTGSIAAG